MNTFRVPARLGCALLLFAAPAAASAQARENRLQANVTVQDSLTTSSARLSDGRYYAAYDYRGTAGQNVLISLGMAPYDRRHPQRGEVVLYWCPSDCTEIDRSFYAFSKRLPHTGDYQVVVVSAAHATGTYALRLAVTAAGAGAAPAPAPNAIEANRPQLGSPSGASYAGRDYTAFDKWTNRRWDRYMLLQGRWDEVNKGYTISRSADTLFIGLAGENPSWRGLIRGSTMSEVTWQEWLDPAEPGCVGIWKAHWRPVPSMRVHRWDNGVEYLRWQTVGVGGRGSSRHCEIMQSPTIFAFSPSQ